MLHRFTAGAAADQAAGLRRMFAAPHTQFLALVHNAFLPTTALVLGRLCAAAGELGLHTLVVDAADNAPPPREMALLDLASCIESLAPEVSYLAARGLPLRYVDTRGCCGGLLAAIERAAPHAELVLVHAGTVDLARLFATRRTRPLLQAGDSPHSLAEAYAALKRLAQRPGWLAHDLLLVAHAQGPRTERLGQTLADCAERFLGAAIQARVVIDPAAAPSAAVDPQLVQLLRAQLAQHRLFDPDAVAPRRAASAPPTH